jgi:hypothetical protein
LELQLQTRESDAGRRGLRSGLLGLGGAVAGVALRPVAAGIDVGRRAERELREAVLTRAEAAALAAFDALLVSRLADEIVDRALASPLARRAVERALAGPLVEAIEQLLADGVLDQTVARVLEGPELERVVESALDSAAMERLVVRVIESSLLEEAVERLLQTDELWLMVDEIARSPAVAEAIQRQSLGFADEVAGGMRSRSRRIDDRLESGARRVFRRKPRVPPAPEGSGG